MFLGPGARSKTSVRQKLVKALASAITTTTPTDGSVIASKLAGSALGSGVSMINGMVQGAVAGNAFTAALTTLANANPTAADPIYIVFRDITAGGNYTVLTLTSAISIAISSGSTMGAVSGQAFRLWLVCFNDAGTPRLALINCLNPNPWNIYALGQFPVASSTAEGGAGAADSVFTFYTGTAVASKAYAVLGYFTWETGLATAGTWNAGPSRIELFRPWTPLPGALISSVENRVSTSTTGTTIIPDDNTTPQSTEGDQYMTQSITPTSAANLMRIKATGHWASSTSNGHMIAALFQDAGANALAVSSIGIPALNLLTPVSIDYAALAALTTSTTFKIRAGQGGAATTTFNGENGAALFNGLVASFLRIEELMA